LSFEGPPDAEIATRAAESIDRAATRIGQVLSTLPLLPVPVVLYSNEQFRDITRAPDWAAGAFDGIVRIPVRDALADPAELDRVLAHEFTHAVVYSLAPRGVPIWLNEGLATVLESEGPGVAESAVTASPEARSLSLRLLARPFGGLPAEAAAVAYGKSALAARRLLDEAGGFAIANLLRDIESGAPFEELVHHRPQVDIQIELLTGNQKTVAFGPVAIKQVLIGMGSYIVSLMLYLLNIFFEGRVV